MMLFMMSVAFSTIASAALSVDEDQGALQARFDANATNTIREVRNFAKTSFKPPPYITGHPPYRLCEQPGGRMAHGTDAELHAEGEEYSPVVKVKVGNGSMSKRRIHIQIRGSHQSEIGNPDMGMSLIVWPKGTAAKDTSDMSHKLYGFVPLKRIMHSESWFFGTTHTIELPTEAMLVDHMRIGADGSEVRKTKATPDTEVIVTLQMNGDMFNKFHDCARYIQHVVNEQMAAREA